MKDNEKQLLQELRDQLLKTNDLIRRSNEIINQKEEIIEKQRSIIKNQNEELITWNQIEQSGKWFDMKETAKILGYKKIGRNTLFGILRDHEILMSNNEPYQQYVNSEYFKVYLKYIEQLDETKCITMISSKGIDFIRKLLTEEGYV